MRRESRSKGHFKVLKSGNYMAEGSQSTECWENRVENSVYIPNKSSMSSEPFMINLFVKNVIIAHT